MILAEGQRLRTDQDLLRTYEPVVRFNHGELFFPTHVDGYLAECDLLLGSSERDREVLVPVGGLTTDRLAAAVAPPGETLYLRLVQRPLAATRARALARTTRSTGLPRSWPPGPRRAVRAARRRRLLGLAPAARHGSRRDGRGRAGQVRAARVRPTRDTCTTAASSGPNGWIVLQYLYFYFMNDYRSTF